jgi:hypothetical protein
MRHSGATRHGDAPPKMFVGRQDRFLMGCGSKVIRVGVARRLRRCQRIADAILACCAMFMGVARRELSGGAHMRALALGPGCCECVIGCRCWVRRSFSTSQVMGVYYGTESKLSYTQRTQSTHDNALLPLSLSSLTDRHTSFNHQASFPALPSHKHSTCSDLNTSGHRVTPYGRAG